MGKVGAIVVQYAAECYACNGISARKVTSYGTMMPATMGVAPYFEVGSSDCPS
jgi:hypothetical protein